MGYFDVLALGQLVVALGGVRHTRNHFALLF